MAIETGNYSRGIYILFNRRGENLPEKGLKTALHSNSYFILTICAKRRIFFQHYVEIEEKILKCEYGEVG